LKEVAIAMGLVNSSGGFFGAAEDSLSGHVSLRSHESSHRLPALIPLNRSKYLPKLSKPAGFS
jgi:hypothetical protein